MLNDTNHHDQRTLLVGEATYECTIAQRKAHYEMLIQSGVDVKIAAETAYSENWVSPFLLLTGDVILDIERIGQRLEQIHSGGLVLIDPDQI